MSYFWDIAKKCINSDIERHNKEEKYLLQKINELESQEEISEFDARAIKTYRNFLCELLQSKAELVSKIGRK